jgi:predicted dehydrogenase
MPSRYSRRKFITDTTKSIGYLALTTNSVKAFAGCANHSETKREEHIMNQKAQNKLGIALVGLGGYSNGELAPALQETQHCYLAGIVTGTPSKAENWKKKYNIPDKNIYNYQTFDSIKDNPDIDIVYVVLPNALHAEYVIRAAKAGKHVICEKPMATSVEDCDRMIAACKEAGKMLSIGYRLHFEPHNLEMMRLGKEKSFGKITALRAENGFSGPHGWRINKKLAGGGPLMDMGIYCVQGVRYTMGMEPIAVKAKEGPKTDKETFKEVEQSISWQFEFPGNVMADCKTSYADNMSLLHADAENGWFELKPALGYSGLDGSTSKGPMNLPNVNQQAKQMDDFAMAVKEKRPTPVPGEMGRQDVKLLMAIYKAAETGQRVEI